MLSAKQCDQVSEASTAQWGVYACLRRNPLLAPPVLDGNGYEKWWFLKYRGGEQIEGDIFAIHDRIDVIENPAWEQTVEHEEQR